MPAKIHSIEALKNAKAALAKFAEDAGALLATVDSDVARMGQWLTHERPAHWKSQVRKREEMVQAARQEISRKQLAAAPEPASTVLERRALQRAQEKLAEAQKRQQNTRRWIGVWDKESLMARGAISQLNDFVRVDIPKAIARIDRMMEQVEEYLAIQAPTSDLPVDVGSTGGAVGDGHADASMARPASDEKPAISYEYLRPFAAEAMPRAKPPREEIAWGALAIPALSEQEQFEIYGLAIQEDATQRSSEAAKQGRGEEGVPPTHTPTSSSSPTPSSSSPIPHSPLPIPLFLSVASTALDKPLVWLLRSHPLDDTDSGWYLGPLDNPGATGPVWKVPIADVLAGRPDLQTLLGKGFGTLAVLGPEGVIGVYDAQGRNVWLAEG